MIDISTLIAKADAYKVAAGLTEDSTVSYRVFGDTKKLSALRGGADITVSRFNSAMNWFDRHWPQRPQPAAPAAPSEDPPHVSTPQQS